MASLLLLFLSFASLIQPGASNIIPSNSAIVGFVQSLQDPRYDIILHGPESGYQRGLLTNIREFPPFEQDPDLETIVMTDAEKRKFLCTLPKSTTQEKSTNASSERNDTSASLTSERGISKTPDELLASLKELCFLRHEGWWTYEFCHHGSIKQIHAKDKVIQQFVLGVYDAEATANLHQDMTDVSSQKDHRSKTAAQRYHSHLYTNGTLCDLTNEPRQTEVRFVCADTGKNMISSITEASTCKYTLIFNSPILCKHPLFQEERPQSLVINCQEIPPPPADVEEAIEVEEDGRIDMLPTSEDSREN